MMEIEFDKAINRMKYKKGKGSFKELTEQRALGMTPKEAVEMLEHYTALHNTWSFDKLPPANVYDKLILKTKTAPEFLSFMVTLGDAGIYWHHDWETKTVVIAFENYPTRVLSMSEFKKEINARLGEGAYKESGIDIDSKFDLNSVFKAK